MSVEEFYVRLTFLEPFRVVPWVRNGDERKGDRIYQRGGTYARWHKINDSHGQPYITGTMLRSAVLREIENTLTLHNTYGCCPGGTRTTEGKLEKPLYLRRRDGFEFENHAEKPCSEEDPCPLCLIQGRFDKLRRDEKKQFVRQGNISFCSVNFSNLNISSGIKSFSWEEIAVSRVVNRVDPNSGKAKDFFRVWEIDHKLCPNFLGKMSISLSEKLEDVKALLAVGLAQVNVLSGALCRVDIIDPETQKDTVHQHLIQQFVTRIQDKEKGDAADIPAFTLPPAGLSPSSNEWNDTIKSLAEKIRKIKELEQGQKLRQMADVIRELRRKTPAYLDQLPAGKPEGRESIWEKTPTGETLTLRQLLKSANVPGESWRAFCEELGEQLYRLEKNLYSHARPLPRLLGETEFYGQPARKSDDPPMIRASYRAFPSYVWVLDGILRAETPFYFGTETSEGQTSQAIILCPDGSYRLPRSLLRGVIRRDLRAILGTGCNVSLGKVRPCSCPVCEIMRRITVQQGVSSYREPAEVRQRIRSNPHTGTVEEGALFDLETGPQGMTFPFRLYFRTRSLYIDRALWLTINHWQEGKAIFGGDIGVGMGRFRLENLQIRSADLVSRRDFSLYLRARGLKGLSREEVTRIGLNEEQWEAVMADDPGTHYNPFPWEKISYTLLIHSPLISNDPIAAMLDHDNKDAVMVQKTVLFVDESGNYSQMPHHFLKGSGIRGACRFLLGRKDAPNENGLTYFEADHEECDCLFCSLFGSKHYQGKLRFEDAELQDEVEAIKCDHVAIDRFHGGTVHRMKYDDYPLPGSPNRPLRIKGNIWVKRDLSDTEKEAVKDVLTELRDGLIPLGANGGAGYGRIQRLMIDDGPGWLALPERKEDERPQPSFSPVSLGPVHVNLKSGSDTADAYYYHPHYFLEPPSQTVSRELDIISHARTRDSGGEALLTGRILCRLITRGPIFIPDTNNDNAFGLEGGIGHKNYRFFRINDELAIPGSELRGMVSSVYEALTNSCFRIMEEGRYLSRRMGADEFKDFHPGIVVDGAKIREMKRYRLPLYDTPDKTSRTKEMTCPELFTRKDGRPERAKKFNEEIAKVAVQNRAYLLSLDEKERREVLLGNREVTFDECPDDEYSDDEYSELKYAQKYKDFIAVLKKNGQKRGYIKFTGPNTANKKNEDAPDKNYRSDWDPFKLNILLESDPECRVSNIHCYPRPLLVCIKDKAEYRIHKRCEAIFCSIGSPSDLYDIPQKVSNQYRTILQDYNDNTGKIVEIFRTQIKHDQLTTGDLVYFKPAANGQVNAVIPVSISRKTDENPLAKRFKNDSLRPCAGLCVEDCNECPARCKKVADYFNPHPRGLCPACHLFGTTFYKGRVRFGFAWLTGEDGAPRWYKGPDPCDSGKGRPMTIPLLERPRPTWSIPDNSFDIPGRKFYVHHPYSVDGIDGETRTPNNRTIEPLAEGNEFVFDIDFENLRDWELGLLLYSLELEDSLAHKLGLGKPLGFGTVQINIRGISLKNGSKGWDTKTGDDKNQWIKKGFAHLGIDIKEANERPYIKQLRELLWVPTGDNLPHVRYPELESKTKDVPGYTSLLKEKDLADRVSLLKAPWKPWKPWSGTAPHPDKGTNRLRASIVERDRIQRKTDTAKPEKKEETKVGKSSSSDIEKRYVGTVKWFNDKKGYGFILYGTDEEIFVHRSGVADNSIPKEGQKVGFRIERGARGSHAVEVKAIE